MKIEEALAQLRNGPGINEDVSEEYNEAVDMAIEALEQEPRKGHWIEHEQNGISHIECSECLTWFLRCHLLRNSFCPNCGCRMVDFESQESEDNK